MTTTSTLHSRRNHYADVANSGIFPFEAPFVPSDDDRDHHDGYTLGRAGILLDLAGRSGAFVTGYLSGADEKARTEMKEGIYKNLNGDPAF